MTDLQVFMDRLEVSLHEKFMACEDAAVTPCQILLYVLNSVADARNEVYGGTKNLPTLESAKKLFALIRAAKNVPLGDDYGHLLPWQQDLFYALQNYESQGPGCVHCMKAGTTVKQGEICPKCGDMKLSK